MKQVLVTLTGIAALSILFFVALLPIYGVVLMRIHNLGK